MSRRVALLLTLAFLTMQAGGAERRRSVVSPKQIAIVPVEVDHIRALVADGDGSIWFSGSKTGRILADGTVRIVEGMGGSIAALTVDKRLCFTRIVGFFPRRAIRCVAEGRAPAEYVVRPAVEISSMVGSPDGSVWFNENSKDRVGFVSPDGVIHELALPPSLDGPRDLTVTDNGRIWFASRRAIATIAADGSFRQFDAEAQFAKRTEFGSFTEIEAGDNGTFWVAIVENLASEARTGSDILRMDADGNFTPPLITLPLFNFASGLHRGGDDSLWFVDTFSLHGGIHASLVRLYSDGTLNRYELPTSLGYGYYISALTVDRRGTVWMALDSYQYPEQKPLLARLDP